MKENKRSKKNQNEQMRKKKVREVKEVEGVKGSFKKCKIFKRVNRVRRVNRVKRVERVKGVKSVKSEEDHSLVQDGIWARCSKLDATRVSFLKKTPPPLPPSSSPSHPRIKKKCPMQKTISPTERDRVALSCAEHAKHGSVQVGTV